MRAFDGFRLAAIKTVNLGRRLAFGCKWTPRAAQTAALARKEASTLKHDCVQETHFTVALGHMGEGLAAERLKYLGFQYERALAQAQAIVGTGTVTMESTAIPFSDGVRRIITVAQRLSLRDGLWYFGTDHLFLALLQEPEKLLRQLVEAKGLVLHEYRTETENIYRDPLKKRLLHSEPMA
jgi:ATP-dependent Clp protease ATP-binding subunit ClpA